MKTASRWIIASLLCVLVVACGSAEPAASPTDLPAVEETVETADEPTEVAEGGDDTEETADTDDDQDKPGDTQAHANGLDIDLFFDGALAEDATIQDCTLADGTETTCYEITIAGYPANYDVGPFCPETITTLAEDAGIWFDGNGVYDVDGEFVLGLADLYNDPNWKLYDDDGNVNITDTQEEFGAFCITPPGSRGTLLPLRPLRTERETFASLRSSLSNVH